MFSQAILDEILIHAIEDYPNEACGVIMADGYHKLANVSATPETAFDCDDTLLPLLAAGKVLAVVHSHPNGPIWPSAYDMQQQMAMAVPWGVIACDAESALPVVFWNDAWDPPPLIGREFRTGPSGSDGKGDCAALVRDWYRLERGITLKEFPRENFWWLKPDVSYAANMHTAGFKHVDMRTPEVGDVFLAAIRSRATNHAGIYIGNGMIMHHLEGRLSRIEPLLPWARFITDWMRYEPTAAV